MNDDDEIYFDSFGVECIPKEIKNYKSDTIMSEYFCTGFVCFVLKGKNLLDYTNLFFPNEYEKNDKIILKSFQKLKRLRWKSLYLWSI